MDIPQLRQDLRLLPGQKNEAGEDSWLLYDPLRHQYFALSRTALSLLRHLRSVTSLGDLKARLVDEKTEIDDVEIEQFIQFVSDNFLAIGADKAHVDKMRAARDRRRAHWLMWLIHNYLFIKIPLLRPDALLGRLLGVVKPLAAPLARRAMWGLGAYGVIALFWQWEAFATTFDYFFNWQGLFYYTLALIGVKIAHELGHALVAKHHGLRVSSMGVALLVLFPVLYTDNTDAWRLTDQRKKLQIVMAGLLVELHIALLALFAWGMLDDGPLRSVAFFLATTSIAGSLLVNLSPFMRFDGYYALADFLGMQNLQPRAFELTRWQLRQWLFGLPENAPEPFARNKHMFLVAYSLATWVYRFFLFLGIALLVYFMAFKLLGLLLFAVEIVWFIGRPIFHEMRRWWQKRALFSLNRQTKRSLTVFIVLLGLALLPWRGGISAPAILESRNQLAIHLPEAAQLQQLFVAPQDYVNQGDILLIADSPALRHEIEQQARKTRLLELQVRRYATSAGNLRNKLLSEQKLAEAQSRLSALQDRLAALTLKAPQNGRVQLSTALAKGQWLAAEDQLLFIFTPQSHRIIAYIHENQMHRVKAGSHAKFIANDGTTGGHHATLSGFDSTAVERLSHIQLASLYGGPIAVTAETDAGQGKPESAHYKAYADLRRDDFTLAADVQGYLHIETARFSPISNLLRSVSALLVRESGF